MHHSDVGKSASHVRRQVVQVILSLEHIVTELKYLSNDIKVLGKQIDVVTDQMLEQCPLNSHNINTLSLADNRMITVQDGKASRRLHSRPLAHLTNSHSAIPKEQFCSNPVDINREENTFEEVRGVGSDKENLFSVPAINSGIPADCSQESAMEGSNVTESSETTVIATLRQSPNRGSTSPFARDTENCITRANSADATSNGEFSPNNNSTHTWELLQNKQQNKDQSAKRPIYPVSPNNNSTGFSFGSGYDENTCNKMFCSDFLVGNEIYNENLKRQNGKFLTCETCMYHHGVLRQDRIELLFNKMEIEKAFDKVDLDDKKLRDSVNFNGGFLKQLHEKCHEYDQNSLCGTLLLEKRASMTKDILDAKSLESLNLSAEVEMVADEKNISDQIFSFCVLPEVEYSGLYEYAVDMTLEAMSDGGMDSNFDEWSEDEGSISLELEYSASYNRDMNTWTSFALVHVDSTFEDDFEFENLGACSGETLGLEAISPTSSRKSYPGNWEDDLEELALTYCSPKSRRKYYF